MKKNLIQFTLLVLLFATVSCKKSKELAGTTPITPITPPIVTNLITLPAGWKVSPTFGTSFPTGIQVYQFDSTFQGQTIKAFCLAYDSKNSNIEFKPVMAATATTPTNFYVAESGISSVYACINGGFFGGNQSFSFVKYNNAVSSANIKVLTRPFNGTNTSYYPTRAAFGVSTTGAPSVAWMYNVGTGNDLIYSYPTASPNALNTAPQEVPTATFPTGGSIWNMNSAIGGSPMLLKANAVNITDAAELIDINNNTSRPRSGIGYNANGIILIVAVEGDNPPNYSGINLANFAELLKSLSCTDAINLDGGGSTSMVIGGTKTVRPGNAGGVERPVVSAIIIKRK